VRAIAVFSQGGEAFKVRESATEKLICQHGAMGKMVNPQACQA